MDLTYKQEVGVGALVIVGVALFLAGMFWLTGRTPGAEGARVEVLFTNISGLKQGDPGACLWSDDGAFDDRVQGCRDARGDHQDGGHINRGSQRQSAVPRRDVPGQQQPGQ